MRRTQFDAFRERMLLQSSKAAAPQLAESIITTLARRISPAPIARPLRASLELGALLAGADSRGDRQPRIVAENQNSSHGVPRSNTVNSRMIGDQLTWETER